MNEAILSLSSTPKSSLSFFSQTNRCPFPALSTPHRVLLGFRPICSASSSAVSSHPSAPETTKHALLLERLRNRHHKDAVAGEASPRARRPRPPSPAVEKSEEKTSMVSSFEELGLSEEVMGAVRDMGISVPTEIQCLGIPAVLDGRNVVLGSHTGSGKTLAYTLPIVQMMRQDEESTGMLIKPKRPRAVVLCPTRELSEQVFRVAKAIGHHARFRSTMVSGGGRLRPQADSLNTSVDMVVGTPGRVLQHIEEGNMVYGDIKYLVLDEADTMFDRGFGPDIRKFLGPLKNRASKSEDQGYQTVLVTATMSKAVQKLVDEEFHGITHIRTSSLHKKIASARHDFIKLSGSENKLDALLQILERSLSKGNRVMVFCNTLNSCRAVDHFLGENNVNTVNYHGQVPAEQRVENLRKFKSEDGECSALVCTDLAARGLDLDVDHVIMFDFPLNSIDYLHRTGRTARMGAKGNVTSLVARKDVLATQIEEAMRKNESLETLTIDRVQKDTPGSRQSHQKGKNTALTKLANHKTTSRVAASTPLVKVSERKPSPAKHGKASAAPGKLTKTAHTPRSSSSGKNTALTKLANHKTTSRVAASKPFVKVSERKPSPAKYGKASAAPGKLTKTAHTPRSSSSGESKLTDHKISGAAKPPTSKLSVVGFRGRSSLLQNEVSPSLT